MDRKDVALGRAAKTEAVGTAIKPPTGVEERLAILEEKFDLMLTILRVNGVIRDREPDPPPEEELSENNKDGIPIGINLIGSTKGQIYVLTVEKDGYRVGKNSFNSLSAAGEAVRGSRVSGWVFWKLPDGRTVKEVFGRS